MTYEEVIKSMSGCDKRQVLRDWKTLEKSGVISEDSVIDQYARKLTGYTLMGRVSVLSYLGKLVVFDVLENEGILK